MADDEGIFGIPHGIGNDSDEWIGYLLFIGIVLMGGYGLTTMDIPMKQVGEAVAGLLLLGLLLKVGAEALAD